MRLTNDSLVKVGQKVRCIDDSVSSQILVEGKTYTIESTNLGDRCITLEDVSGEWYKHRFETVEEEEVIEATPQPVEKVQQEIHIHIEKVGDIVAMDVTGVLSAEQISAMLSIIYGK